MTTNKHNRPDITVQTGNFMAPYGYLNNQHRDHATLNDMIPMFFNLEVKYRNIKDYREALDRLVQRYQDHKTDPDILSGLKSINNYNFITSDENKTILIKVNQDDHITSDFPIGDIFRVYLDTSIYKIMTYDEFFEKLATIDTPPSSGVSDNEASRLQLKDIRKSKVNDININEDMHELDEIYNREVNADMEKNRDQWEEIYATMCGIGQADESNESLTDQSDNDDIKIKLDVIEDLLDDIRDNLKEQEKISLGLTSNKLSNKTSNKFSSTSALTLLSSDENKVTALFLGTPLILVKASINKDHEIIATVQTDLGMTNKNDLFIQVIESRGLKASLELDDHASISVEIKSADLCHESGIKVEDSLPMIAQMAVLVYQLKTISEEDLIDIENSMDMFIGDHTLAEAGWEKI